MVVSHIENIIIFAYFKRIDIDDFQEHDIIIPSNFREVVFDNVVFRALDLGFKGTRIENLNVLT